MYPGRLAISAEPLRAVFLEPKPPNPHIFSLYPLPRLGSAILGTLLRDRGWEVRIYVEEVAPIDFDLVLSADLVGISTITSTAPRSYALADAIRAARIPVVLGGSHVTYLPEEALDHADMVVRGEGEIPMVALAAHFEGGCGLDQVPGLSWRDKGRMVHNPLPEKPVDLDELPIPDLSLIQGFMKNGSFSGTVVPIQTTRGCPYNCTFCSVTGMFGRKVRRRSPENIVRELEHYRRSGAVVFFYDDNFGADREHVRAICRLILASGLDLKWSAQVRLEIAHDEELLDLMHRAGCRTFFIGFESVNQEALAESRKSQSAAMMGQEARSIRRAGIEIHGMFIYGFDSDGSRDLKATLRFAMRTPITTAQFLLLTPFPGTQLIKRLEEEGRILTYNWDLYDTHHVVFTPKLLTPREIQKKQVRSHWRFYSWPRSLLNLIKLKFLRTGIYIYARRINARWKRQNRRYLEALKIFSRSGSFNLNMEFMRRFPEIKSAVAKAQKGLYERVGARSLKTER